MPVSAGAVALMDEKIEMRVHVGDSVQTLRGGARRGLVPLRRSGSAHDPG
jgi:hypothetical protein